MGLASHWACVTDLVIYSPPGSWPKEGRWTPCLRSWLIDWLIDLIDWLIDLIGWLIWLVGWLIDWLVGWLIGWLLDWLIDWLVDWLVDWLIDWLIDLIDWLIDWLIWLIDWLIDWLTVMSVLVAVIRLSRCNVCEMIAFNCLLLVHPMWRPPTLVPYIPVRSSSDQGRWPVPWG